MLPLVLVAAIVTQDATPLAPRHPRAALAPMPVTLALEILACDGAHAFSYREFKRSRGRREDR